MTKKRGRPPIVGRPTRLTTGIMEDLVAICSRGCYMETAASVLGLCVESVRRWMKRGAKENERMQRLIDDGHDVEKFMDEQDLLYAKFSRSIKAALSGAELEDLESIREAGEKQWQAKAWRLERMHPQRYALRARLEHTGNEGGPIQHEHSIDLSKLSNEQLEQLEAIVTSASEPSGDTGGTGSSSE